MHAVLDMNNFKQKTKRFLALTLTFATMATSVFANAGNVFADNEVSIGTESYSGKEISRILKDLAYREEYGEPVTAIDYTTEDNIIEKIEWADSIPEDVCPVSLSSNGRLLAWYVSAEDLMEQDKEEEETETSAEDGTTTEETVDDSVLDITVETDTDYETEAAQDVTDATSEEITTEVVPDTTEDTIEVSEDSESTAEPSVVIDDVTPVYLAVNTDTEDDVPMLYYNTIFLYFDNSTDDGTNDGLIMRYNSDMSYAFSGMNALVDISALKYINAGKVEDMSYMFCGDDSLEDISPLASFVTTSLKNVTGMFKDCVNLEDASALNKDQNYNLTKAELEEEKTLYGKRLKYAGLADAYDTTVDGSLYNESENYTTWSISDSINYLSMFDGTAVTVYPDWYQTMTETASSETYNMDFSSKRLIVITDDDTLMQSVSGVISSYNGMYILQYDTEDEVRYIYSYLVNKVEIIEVDNGMVISSETPIDADLAEEEIVQTDTVMTEEENPISELQEAIESGAGVYDIALIDTGATTSNVYSAISMLGDDPSDSNGHGTQMAEIIAEQNPDATILSIKAFDENGKANISAVYAAFEYAMTQDVKVINLSANAYASENNAVLEEVINRAVAAGIIVVGSAGNNGKNAKYFIPSKIESAIIIGAANEDGIRNSISNYGDTVDYNVVASTTSEAAAKFSGWVSLHGMSAVGDALNQGLIFTTDYVKEEIEETTEETTEEESTTVENTTEETTEEITAETTEEETSTEEETTGESITEENATIEDTEEEEDPEFTVNGVWPKHYSNTISGISVSAYNFSWSVMDMNAWRQDRYNSGRVTKTGWSALGEKSSISDLKPGDVIVWADDTTIGYYDQWCNHVAIVTEVASDGSYFVTADGYCSWTSTGVSFNTRYDFYKSGSTIYGKVLVWRHNTNGEIIAKSAANFTRTIIESNDTSMAVQFEKDVIGGWCHAFVVCALLETEEVQGTVAITKSTSANTSTYPLTGALYSIYTTSYSWLGSFITGSKGRGYVAKYTEDESAIPTTSGTIVVQYGDGWYYADDWTQTISLDAGSYLIAEKVAPTGYELNSGYQTFTVKAGEATELTSSTNSILSDNLKKGTVTLTKSTDANTSTYPLGGALYSIYSKYSDGTYSGWVGSFVTGAGGTGYVASYVAGTASDSSVVPSGAGTAKAYYNGFWYYNTDSSKSISLDAGTYYVLEQVAPNNYQRNTSVYSFAIKAGETIDLTNSKSSIFKDKLQPGTVAITKSTSANTSTYPLTGALYSIYTTSYSWLGSFITGSKGRGYVAKYTEDESAIPTTSGTIVVQYGDGWYYADDWTQTISLDAGSYLIAEKVAPTGYELNSGYQTFTVKAGEATELTSSTNSILSDNLKKGTVTLTKSTDANTSTYPLGGALYSIYSKYSDGTYSGWVGSFVTGAGGTGYVASYVAGTASDSSVVPSGAGTAKAYYNGFWYYNTDSSKSISLDAGTYYVLEQVAPNNYQRNTSVYSFAIKAGETIDLTNSKSSIFKDNIANGMVKITKSVDSPTGKISIHVSMPTSEQTRYGFSLAGTKYGIYSNSACSGTPLQTLTLDANGDATSSALSLGTYYVKEISASSGFKLDSTVHTATLSGTFNKGAVYTVYSGSTAVGTLTCDAATGVSNTLSLAPGTYTLQEKTAATGYNVNSGSYTFTIKPNTETSITSSNTSILKDTQKTSITATVKPTPILDTGYVTLKKSSNVSTSTYPLTGALYSLQGTTQNTYDVWFIVDANGTGHAAAWTTVESQVPSNAIQKITCTTDKTYYFYYTSASPTTATIRPGTYEVTERVYPNIYKTNTKTYTFTVESDKTYNLTASTDEIFKNYVLGDVKITKSVDTPTGTISLTKTSANKTITDDNDCYSLEGAVYGVYSDSTCTTEVGRMTTDASGKASITLELGTYYIKEIKASKGYLLDTTVYTKTLSGTFKKDAVYTVYSGSTAVGELKCDATTGVSNTLSLAPGTYRLQEKTAATGYKKNTDSYQFTITPNTTTSLTSADTAILSDAQETQINVSLDVTETPLSDPGQVQLIKKSAEDIIYIEGAVFKVEYFDNYNTSGTATRTWYYKTDSTGLMDLRKAQHLAPADEYRSDELYYDGEGKITFPLGSIRATEVYAPEGYILLSEPIVGTIKENDGGTHFAWVENGQARITKDNEAVASDEVKHDKVTIVKEDPDGVRLTGAEFTAYGWSDEDQDYTIYCGVFEDKGDGTYYFDFKGNTEAHGKYRIVETKAPDGHCVDEDTKGVIADIDVNTEPISKTETFTAVNNENGVVIKKKDSATRENLSGIEFRIYIEDGRETTTEIDESIVIGYDKDGNEVYYNQTLTTDENGEIILMGLINDMDYTIVETKVPDGYTLFAGSEDTFHVTAQGLIEEQEVHDIEILNYKNLEFTLPTGGIGRYGLYCAGLIVMMCPIILLIIKKKKENLNNAK